MDAYKEAVLQMWDEAHDEIEALRDDKTWSFLARSRHIFIHPNWHRVLLKRNAANVDAVFALSLLLGLYWQRAREYEGRLEDERLQASASQVVALAPAAEDQIHAGLKYLEQRGFIRCIDNTFIELNWGKILEISNPGGEDDDSDGSQLRWVPLM